MDNPPDFTGVATSFGALEEDVVIAGVSGGPLGSGFLLNLRDFKSEALVLGNCTAAYFEDEATGETVSGAAGVWASLASARGFSFTGLCFRFVAEVPGMALRRRFFWRRGSFVVVDIDDDNAEVG